ncbi:GNAT family N-acetyltransferase [Cryobacterium sp. M23]|uniref:GNAT family N-acetyltransferase n=1 Tax=Cryobacterium sp. M23 TaxID=2048292 RepID=UPI000CE30BEC|nr:GNAT family N-acetyltransferase [Cryobacterium sp. M23]
MKPVSAPSSTSARQENDPLRSLADSLDAHPPFTLYMIQRAEDRRAIGGIGFFGAPGADGVVELGYGDQPMRGLGLATEALLAAITIAATYGALRVKADTAVENIASQRAIDKAGFLKTSRSSEAIYYALDLRRETQIWP